MTTRKEHLLMWPILILLGFAVFALVYGVNQLGTRQTMYNCSIAEISPDYTPSMREECRKLRSDK